MARILVGWTVDGRAAPMRRGGARRGAAAADESKKEDLLPAFFSRQARLFFFCIYRVAGAGGDQVTVAMRQNIRGGWLGVVAHATILGDT